MGLILDFGAWLLEYYGNMGIAMGLIFGLILLLRPVTMRLFRPKYQVIFWISAWTMAFSYRFWRLARSIRILPVTFTGLIVPAFDDRNRLPAYIPDLTEVGEKVLTLPGGTTIPLILSGWEYVVLSLLAFAGFVLVMVWGFREEKKTDALHISGEPMSKEWHEAHGLTDGKIVVSVAEGLPTSFVFRGRDKVHYICLQKELPEEQMELVLKHEMAHIRSGHVWFKAVLAAVLLLYWYSPVMWLAYRLTCRDVELACDEAVLKDLDEKQRRTYAHTLVELASGKHLWGGLTCFGESDAEIRVRRVVSWKKEKPWTAYLVWPCLILAFLFLFTSPRVHGAERERRWDAYVQTVLVLEDVRARMDDPTLEIKEIWQRGENLLIRLDDGKWHLFGFEWEEDLGRYRIVSHSHVPGEPGKYEFEKIEAPARGWVGDGRDWEDYVTGPMLQADLQEFMDHPIELGWIFQVREGEVLIEVKDDYGPYWRCSFKQNERNHNIWRPYRAERLTKEEFITSGLEYIRPWSWEE